jgi:hypothetical protein
MESILGWSFSWAAAFKIFRNTKWLLDIFLSEEKYASSISKSLFHFHVPL